MIRLGVSTRFWSRGEAGGTLRGSAVRYFRTFNSESCFSRCARYEVAHEKCCPCPSTQTASCRSRLLAIHLQTARGAVERPLRHRCYQKGSWYLWELVKICVCVRFCIQVLILEQWAPLVAPLVMRSILRRISVKLSVKSLSSTVGNHSPESPSCRRSPPSQASNGVH
jgi:hypothetical protein